MGTAARLVPTLTLACLALPAGAALHQGERLTLSADMRVRAEHDWDSSTATAIERDDRSRIRLRARAWARFHPDDAWTVEFRLRSGLEQSHQSPHITLIDFDDNDTGDADFTFDRWYVGRDGGSGWFWAGRNTFPFWQQNEFLWDHDATMMGVAGGWRHEAGGGRLDITGGFFSPPVGMTRSSGNLGGLQLVYGRDGDTIGWKVAAGLVDFDANPSDIDAVTLLDGNGLRDYRILVLSGQARWAAVGRGLTLGADGFSNLEDYSPTDPDPTTAANTDETVGYVFHATYGELDDRGDWLAAYSFAHIELFAVHASYAQDDWVRWGTIAETRASNLEGHELRFGYRLRDDLDMIARLYLVESITTAEDGNRLRVDLDYRF